MELKESRQRKCDRCSRPHKIFLAYGPHYFCEKHFLEFFERRVKKTVRKFRLIKPGERIAVGVSGGKDSLTTLFLLNEFFSKSNELTALMLDEGIKGYRDKALKTAVMQCRQWKVPYKIVKFKERFGITMQEIMNKIEGKEELGSSCSFCGPMRRHLLNAVSMELKADKIATGHNLDDEVQSIAMNFFDNDLLRMARLGPIAGVKAFHQFVPRIKPLYECPESEIIAYANFKGIKYYGEECCPFSWQAKRNEFRSMINQMESKFPGTKYSILRFFMQLKPLIEGKYKKAELKECSFCGAPSSKELCALCSKLKNLSRQKIVSARKTEAKKEGRLSCAQTKKLK
ncbi:MAG: TIGR00269 family protein [Candidatus Diapherotrites archaeon]